MPPQRHDLTATGPSTASDPARLLNPKRTTDVLPKPDNCKSYRHENFDTKIFDDGNFAYIGIFRLLRVHPSERAARVALPFHGRDLITSCASRESAGACARSVMP